MTMHLTRGLIPKDFAGQEDDGSGAVVVFLGIVRGQSHGRKVLYLEYEAYPVMAENQIGELIREAKSRWTLQGVRILHRTGKILPSEVAVAIEVRSLHRDEAYQASRFLIEAVKHHVPVWKKEFFSDGTSLWGGCGALSENPVIRKETSHAGI